MTATGSDRARPEQIEVTLHADASVSPARALHAAAERLGALAIVVGSTHRGRVGHVLPGGVSTALAHMAACPLLVVPRRDGTRIDAERAVTSASSR